MRPERRLRELAQRHALSADATDTLGRLLALVEADAGAPTAVRDSMTAVDIHVADALVALEVARVREARRVADLGSGAGFPGLVLAAALPAASVALVEANRRKCAFLARAAAQMGLSNVEVIAERAEAWATGIGSHDVVTARAVAPLAVLVEYAAPLLCADGALVAWKGRRDRAEEADAMAAAAQTGLELAEVLPVEPWAGADHLHLHLYVKVAPTPNRFPRRPGIASKRPLRASS